MRSLFVASFSGPILRLTTAALLAGSAAACSTDTSRFNDPNSNPFASNGAAPAVTGSVAAAPSSAVQSAPIASPVASATPYGTPVQPTPYAAAPAGQPIYGAPQRQATAAPAPAPAHPAMAAAGGGTHVVTSGETLSSVSRLYGLPRTTLAAANGLDVNAQVRIGQRLVVPNATGGAVVATAPKTAPATSAQVATAAPKPVTAPKPPAKQPAPKVAEASPPVVQVPAITGPTKKETIAAVQPAITAEDVREPDSGVQFRWPVRGRVISGYGPKPGGQQNEGINVSVPEGTSVKAAEDGVIAYAGNELKGYGNLVLIKHADGWVTAYAHNSEIDVKKGDKVKRGQTIAKAGQTGSVSSPQVHFEIRKGSQAVDPTQHLAGL